LVVLLGGYLFVLVLELSIQYHLPDVSRFQHWWEQYLEPRRFLRLLTQALEGTLIGALAFGLFAIPISIAIAWLVAIFGYKRA
jgi:hypothetical protein